MQHKSEGTQNICSAVLKSYTSVTKQLLFRLKDYVFKTLQRGGTGNAAHFHQRCNQAGEVAVVPFDVEQQINQY